MKGKVLLQGLVLLVFLMLSTTSVFAGPFEGLPCNGNFDGDLDVDGEDVTEFLIHFGRGQYDDPCPFSSTVPKTGQTTQYATGDDGDLEMGVASPNPRFTILYNYWNGSFNSPCDPPTVECENPPVPGNDIVLDNLTGLQWMRNANFSSGPVNWYTALTDIAGWGSLIGGHDDWRLPNINELQTLKDYGQHSPVLPSGHPFENVQWEFYWSSTTYANGASTAWYMHMGWGDVEYDTSKSLGTHYVLAVRSGTTTTITTGPAPVPKTGQTTSWATGDDGDLEKGVEWPNPRYTDNSNGTITDNLTGLIWLKNAACFGQKNWYNALSESNGLADGNCGLTDGSNAGDWRLPNRSELNSLIDVRFYLPALCNTTGTGQWSEGDPFTNVQSDVYWSSTDTVGVAAAWRVYMNRGEMSYYEPSGEIYYVWPVRGGQ